MLKQGLLLVLIGVAAASAQGPGPRGGPGMGPRGMGGNGPLQFLGAEPGQPGAVVTGAPYSAEAVTDINRTLPDGNKIHQTNTTRIYRDTQGRTRREPELSALSSAAPGSTMPSLAFVDDPVAGVRYALDLTDHTATKMTLPAPPAGAARPNRPPRAPADSANTKVESLGRQLVNGVPADGTRTTITIPAGQIGNAQPIQIVSETWYSPDLQLTVLSRRSDPRSGDRVYQLNNLSRAEPPSTLFVVPADFKVTERTPGMRMRMRNRGALPPQ
ncbi:MAG TPA: hypothetical protein VKT49_16215 [Bryobacteraceae bacterium]|nr:hypothetical protein [Bryobacteraceae bacterium]